MGTGKSSVGRMLAQMTGMEFIDLDALIIKEAGRSINDIFASEGERYFRDLETSVLRKISHRDNMIIATGGGAVLAGENRTIFRQMGVVVNLIASPENISCRLQGADDRPLLKNGGEQGRITRLMLERELFYADADIRIDTDDKKIEDVAAEIMSLMQQVT